MSKRNDDILAQAAERFKLVADYDRDEREQADDDIRFACNDDGYQWPDDLKAERESDGRPCLVLNKIPEKIDQVDGEFKQMSPSFKVRAIDSHSDPKLAEIISGIMRHIEYNSDAKSAYYNSHTSTLLCGRGAWRIDIIDAEDDPFVRDIKINRIPNVLTVYWDPYCKQANKSDANYIFVTELVDKKEFEKNHKDVVESWPTEDVWDNWRTDDSYRIAEYWWKEKAKKTYYRVIRQVDNVQSEITVTEPGPIDQVIETKEVDGIKVKWCKMVAKTIIEGPHDWPTADIPIIVELGKEINIRGKGKTRGMVRHAKDPMRMYNYWASMATEQIALIPKAPYVGTAAMFAPYQEYWNNAHKKNYPYLPFELDERALGMAPRREPPPQMSSAYQAEFARLEHDIMSAMGIYAASLGDEGQEVSGRAIMARQRQGNIGSYPYTDSFNMAYTYSNKQLIRLIPHVYDTERIVRIIGEDGNEDTVPINARPDIPQAQMLPEKLKVMPKDGISGYLNDISSGKYDVAVTIGPSYTTQKEETFAILMDMVKTAPQIGQAIMDLIASNLDIPKHSEELVNRLRKMVPIGIRELEPGEKPPEQQPDPQMMFEMAKLQMEKETKDRDLDRKEFEAQTKAILDLATAESKEIGNQIQTMMAIMGEIRAKIDQDHGIQTKEVEMQHGMDTRNRELDLQESQMQAAQAAQSQPSGETTES